ncbi:MAG: translation initiation factor eIF-1A [Nanoarchaeota archaeon]
MRNTGRQEENEVDEYGQPIVTRAKLPRGKEIIGIIEQRLGGNKMMVNCLDGKSRNCRVPGRLKRKLWLRPNDVVLIEPWELDFNRGDVIFKYPSNQIAWLRKNKYLSDEKKEF